MPLEKGGHANQYSLYYFQWGETPGIQRPAAARVCQKLSSLQNW